MGRITLLVRLENTVKVENYAEINLCGKGVDTPLFSGAKNLIVRISFITNH